MLDYSPKNQAVQLAFAKGTEHMCRVNGKIACSISGGSDSDIMLDMVYHLDNEKQVTYVFFDTGIEYDATKKHLDYLEEKYGIKIEREKAVKPISTCCKEYGIPWFSKWVSEMMSRLQKHNFQWEDESYDELIKKYLKCQIALKWWCNENGEKSRYNINRNKLLKEFIQANPPKFKISNKCCHYAKKLPAKHFLNNGDFKMNLVGVRKAEGGIRATNYKSCFTSSMDGEKDYDEWRPLFWLTDQDKREYEEHCGIIHSDCYTKYGLTRTGCVGCPYNSRFENELNVIKTYEPKFSKFVESVFGQAYEYTRKYREFKNTYKPNLK